MPLAEKIYQKNPDFVQREIAGEFLLIPIRRQLNETNNLYVMNETGTTIWKFIDGRRSLAQIKSDLIKEFDVLEEQLEKDLVILIDDLISIQAIHEKSSD